MKNIFRAVGILAATFGLVLGVNSSTAMAGSDGPEICNSGACVWFKQTGDKIYVNDYKADGHSAVAQVCAPSGCTTVSTNIWNTAGSGTTIWYGFGTDISEGTNVYYRACVGESGTHTLVGTCSGWTHGQA